jgi:hypothetical protein
MSDIVERIEKILEQIGGEWAYRPLLAEARDEIKRLNAQVEQQRKGLEASVKLQSHYAYLLNMHDGGKRLLFHDASAWMDRLAKLTSTDGSTNA